jgi:DNA-binding MarR family transcriptional regulator
VSRTNKFGDCKTQTIVNVLTLRFHREGGLFLFLRDNSRLGAFGIHVNMIEEKKINQKSKEIGLLMAMLRFASVISRPMRDGVADPAGFSSNELRILMALSGEGESAGHDLAELMGMHAMNVSRALASLHHMGLVEPAKNIKNRRRKPYRISARGARAHVALEPSIAQVARHLFGALTARERAALVQILAKLDRQVEAWQPSERRPHVPRA